jgi:hypothetical protein
MGKRIWAAAVLTAILCWALAYCWLSIWPYLSRAAIGPPHGELPQTLDCIERSTEELFVGHLESRIVQQFGLPTQRWEGHYGNPPVRYCRTYPDAITFTYERPTGTLFLSFCREGPKLVCFSSDWLPSGWAF